jgi:hypothetical protein
MEVPTMQIKVGDHPVVINVSDFDPATMERWEEPQAKAVREPEAKAAEEPPKPPAQAEGVEDVSESSRRRPSRG